METTSASAEGCLHCGAALPASSGDGFCCAGCRLVHALLRREDLGRYYDLRGGVGQPVALPATGKRDLSWLEPIVEDLRAGDGPRRVAFDLQGIHCAGCVWLVEELFRKQPGGVGCTVNPALGSVQVVVSPAFDLRGFVEHVERFGYLLGPAHDRAAHGSTDLLLRMGLAIAIAMNSMIFAIALYAGLDEGPLFRFFHLINFGLSSLSVLVGAPVFVRPAWQALRRGIVHVDLPIALGIVLAFASSVHGFLTRGGSSAYFDTLNVFIALMLVGRFLQERVLERNRRLLLENDGVDGLRARRVEGGAPKLVRCTEIVAGDELLLAPGDLVPVAAMLEGEDASFSLDWIDGESAPRIFAGGNRVPAGAFLAGARSTTVRAAEAFDASMLVELLRSPPARDDRARATPWWQRYASLYVTAVLVAAIGGGIAGWIRTHRVGSALDVVTAVLIVTCPCAFGIATPLAYELVQAGLRRAGLFVRSASFLDRALDVTQVVFDKTGTITTGRLRLVDASPLAALESRDRDALFALVARSAHPKSVAVRTELDALGAAFLRDVTVDEEPGRGVAATIDGRRWALGAPAWIGAEEDEAADLAISIDGRVVARLATVEDVRGDARHEMTALAAGGYGVALLTGDSEARARAIAAECGLPADRIYAQHSPRAKAAWVRQNDAPRMLFVGDGINDGLAAVEAGTSGTPAIDRPFMAARTDFYFVTPGLRPVRLALEASRALAHVVHRNLGMAIAYNAAAIALAWTGHMSPLAAAVFMPLSSLTVVVGTVFSLSARSPLWKS